MKNNISYEHFLERVDKYHHQFKNAWRFGQTYFAVLSSVRSDIAEDIRGTLHDPSYKDKISKETEKFVKSRW